MNANYRRFERGTEQFACKVLQGPATAILMISTVPQVTTTLATILIASLMQAKPRNQTTAGTHFATPPAPTHTMRTLDNNSKIIGMLPPRRCVCTAAHTPSQHYWLRDTTAIPFPHGSKSTTTPS